jgi:hypothetical protein
MTPTVVLMLSELACGADNLFPREVIDATSWLNAVEGAFSRGCRT